MAGKESIKNNKYSGQNDRFIKIDQGKESIKNNKYSGQNDRFRKIKFSDAYRSEPEDLI